MRPLYPVLAYLHRSPYTTAVLSVGGALVLMLTLNPLARMTQTPFLLFFGAVVVSAWQAGIRAGVIATLLAALISNFFFLEPRFSLVLDLTNTVRLVIFVLECLLISVLCGSLRATNQRLDRNLLQLQVHETSLRSANQRVIDVLESITSGFYILDRQRRFVYVNSHAEEIMRKTREEMLGQSVWVLFPGALGTSFEHNFHQAADEQVPLVFETHGVANPSRWFEVHVNPLHDGLAVYFQDITNRRAAEETLRKSTAILNAINASTPTLIYVKDRQGRIMMANSALLNRLDKSEAEVIGKTNAEILLNSQAADQITANDQTVIETGQVLTFEEVLDFPSGSRAYLSSKSPYRDEQGHIIGLIGVSTDISDRKQVENALRQSEERLRLALDAGHMGAWEWNLETNVQRWDVNQYKLLGMDKDKTELKADTFFRFIHPDDLPPAQALTEQVLAQGGSFSTEFRIIRPDGSISWLSSQGMVVHGSNHQPIRLIGVNFDITARKQAEAEREQLLLREQAARQEAEAANRIKDEFLAVLSHELRSPLNPILGWAKLLRLGRLDAAKTHHALETIERNAQLQTQLIEDLLDVSRILQGKLSLTMAPVDLAAVIEAALETVRLAAEAKAIEVKREETAEKSLMVLGDPARLQQVVWNLLSNAVKFTPAGGQVEVRLARAESQGQGAELSGSMPPAPPSPQPSHPQFAEITIIDTGKGIHPDFLPYVFEYFRQADSTTTRKFGGLGLGLAIVRHLVELHGGRVEAHSGGPGAGAEFVVTLPLTGAAADG
ncbi:MAG: PAS domain-containing protein, partial [Cyanobacteria bacterium Co-bin13]|nr:PAS domain-containing protein [Cyanobacteria bacterium Co-bin13]